MVAKKILASGSEGLARTAAKPSQLACRVVIPGLESQKVGTPDRKTRTLVVRLKRRERTLL